MLHHLLFHGLFKHDFTQRVEHTFLLSQVAESSGPNIVSGLSKLHPVTYARATNGWVYIFDGLSDPVKWNGIDPSVVIVGIAAPTTAVVVAASGNGSLTGSYRAYVRFLDAEGNISNLSPVSNTIEATSVSTINYSDVEVSTDAKVTRRQILRNTDGQLLTFYVDVDSTDLSSTSFSSTKTDTQLRASTAVPLFSEDLSTQLANRNAPPPDDKPLVVYYQNRLWAYGEVVYSDGHAKVTFGSTTVTGVGTQWTAAMEGRFFYVDGARKSYEISSVNKFTQTITLTSDYLDSTDIFAQYKIRPAPARRHVLAYSEPGRFDAWPATQTLEVASSDDIDDQPAGLMSTHSFLYILQNRHIYRLSFLADPATDGGIFLSARRGVVNDRVWANVDGFMYGLDDRGIYRFDGSDATEDLSQPIQDLFYFNRESGQLRINWRASRFFHASHDRHEATIRWFVSLSGDRLPRHAICLNYSTPQWWLEEYPWPIGDSALKKGSSSIPIAAGPHRKVLAMQFGTLDVVDPQDGDTRALVASATRTTAVVAASATLPVNGMVGATVSVVSGRGKGQTRIIAAVSARTITVDRPWSISLDTTSKLQVGGIPWKWKSGWMDWPIQEQNQPRKIAVGFQPGDTPNTMDLRVYEDYSKTATPASLTWPANDSDSIGISTENQSADAVVDLEQSKGYAELVVDSYAMYHAARDDIFSVEVAGFAGASPVVLYQIIVYGAVPKE